MKIFLENWVKTQDCYYNFTKNLRETKQMLSQLIRILYIYIYTLNTTLNMHILYQIGDRVACIKLF